MLTRLDLVLYGVSRPTIPETRYPVPGTPQQGVALFLPADTSTLYPKPNTAIPNSLPPTALKLTLRYRR